MIRFYKAECETWSLEKICLPSQTHQLFHIPLFWCNGSAQTGTFQIERNVPSGSFLKQIQFTEFNIKICPICSRRDFTPCCIPSVQVFDLSDSTGPATAACFHHGNNSIWSGYSLHPVYPRTSMPALYKETLNVYKGVGKNDQKTEKYPQRPSMLKSIPSCSRGCRSPPKQPGIV
jgi:hypothetical protein